MYSYFFKTVITCFGNKKVILKGKRNFTDRLWDVPLWKTIPPKIEKLACLASSSKYNSKFQGTINYIVTKDKTKLELAQYLHVCAFSPAVKTLQAWVRRGNFIVAGNRRLKLQVYNPNYNGYS